MKKLSLKFTSLGVMAVAVSLFVACQKEAISKPNFIFKASPSSAVVAKIGGEEISEKEFVAGIESELYEAEMKVYDLKMARLKSMTLEKLMMKDPKKGSLSNDEFLDKEIAKNIKISDTEVNKFIVDRQIPNDQVTPDIKEKIVEFLKVEAKKTAIDNWIAQKTKSTPVEVYFAKPELPFFNVEVGNAPSKGDAAAKVTIIEFSDFQCPFCSRGAQVLTDLEKKYGKKIKIAFKHYPLPFHAQAKIAAQASMCANEQNPKLFWSMHDEMFKDQSKLDRDNLIATAKKIGVKEADFTQCLDSQKYLAQVEADIAQGQAASVKSTPTFFINGKLVAGAQPVEYFSEIIDAELAK